MNNHALGFANYLNERWRRIFTTPDGAIFWGGLLVWFSAFLTYAYGPMGGRLTQIDFLRNVDFSWLGIGWLLSLSGVFLAHCSSACVSCHCSRFDKIRFTIQIHLRCDIPFCGRRREYHRLLEAFRRRFHVETCSCSSNIAATLLALSIVALCDCLSTSKSAVVHIVGVLAFLLTVSCPLEISWISSLI